MKFIIKTSLNIQNNNNRKCNDQLVAEMPNENNHWIPKKYLCYFNLEICSLFIIFSRSY